MTVERFLEIMNDTGLIKPLSPNGPCNALSGLNLIAKYLPTFGVESVESDILYGAEVAELAEAGITEEDAIALRGLHWFVREGSLACWV